MRGILEYRWVRSLAGYAGFLILVAVAGSIAYDVVQESARPTVIRIIANLAAIIILLRLRSQWREDLTKPPYSEFAQPASTDARPTGSAKILEKLRDEVRLSIRSRRYFTEYLLPRLEKLGRQADVLVDISELHEPHRWSRNRGPSRADLDRMIERLERGS